MTEPDTAGAGAGEPRRPVAATALAVGLLLLGALGLTALVRWFWTSADPTTDLVVQLKTAERTGLELAIDGESGPLRTRRLRYERLTVELAPGEPSGVVTATLDLEGTLEGTFVHSLGYERVPFAKDGYSWEPPEGLAPMLSKALGVLAARRRALDAGQVAPLAKLARQTVEQVRADPALSAALGLKERRYRVKGWYLRLERDSALVSEDYHLTGITPDRPIDEQGTRRLELRLDAKGEFYFARGLM